MDIRRSLSALFVALLALPAVSFAAGYAVLEQSAEGTGTATAGGVTGYGDGSEAFLNPAALSQIDETQLTVAGHLIVAEAEFENTGSTVSGTPNIGGNKDGGQTFIVPNVYIAKPICEGTVVGFAFNAPFGLATEYDREWAGRYQADRSELTILNFSGSVGHQITDNFSLGASLGAIYADAELSNAVDFGTIGVSSLGLPTASSLGLLPQQADGHVTFDGEDWGLGWGVGALFTYGENNRVGLSYRGSTDLTLHGGEADFEVPDNAQILTSGGAFTDSAVRAEATLPESVQLGVEHWVTEEIALLYEATWTRWTQFDELRITYDNPAQGDSVTEEGWNNVWRHAVGGRYVPEGPWSFSGGFAYDESPVGSDRFRTPRVPDTDRYWVAAGVGYNVNDRVDLQFSYAHVFTDSESSASVGPTGDQLVGDWDSQVDIVSLSLLWRLS